MKERVAIEVKNNTHMKLIVFRKSQVYHFRIQPLEQTTLWPELFLTRFNRLLLV